VEGEELALPIEERVRRRGIAVTGLADRADDRQPAAVTGHREVEGPVTFWEDEEQAHHEPHVRITPTAVVSARIFRTMRAREKCSARTPARNYKKHSRFSQERIS